ncbi:MAG: hypothetical protein H6658_07110 [Ardenticatenaceae bacterium]|nr:hypothetical protein [Ardenticatenaceae bacterium]
MSEHLLDFMWERYPQRQKWSSSVWWFYLLFPQSDQGFSRQQAMFTLVSRVGQQVAINDVWHTGLKHPPETAVSPHPETLNLMALGWIHDGQKMHDQIVCNPLTGTLQHGSVGGWQADTGYGGAIRAAGSKPYQLHNQFTGPRGQATFDFWGSPAAPTLRPEPVDMQTGFGDAHVLYWGHGRFAGEFATPDGRIHHWQGIGYFQRICLNILPFPWKWIYAIFDDESIFSCFIPYLGPHLLRRGHWFFPNWLEQATLPIRSSGYFSRSPQHEQIYFDNVRVTPLLQRGQNPDFAITCANQQGDTLQFRANSHCHKEIILKRPLLTRHLTSHYHYNEYLFEVGDFQANINGTALDQSTLGKGVGNCEYTWGLGL